MPLDEFRDKSAAAATADRFSATKLLAVAALVGGFIGAAA
jgi:uncharacterized membrane protein YsdA (DUF1294 family)